MELFLQRSQKERVSRPRFELWAKFDLSPDEKLGYPLKAGHLVASTG